MARRSRVRYSGRRDHNRIANPGLPVRSVPRLSPVRPVVFPRPVFSDRRRWSPVYAPVDSVRRDQRRLVPRGRNFAKVGFSVPERVSVCVRRSVRKQVLFAKGVGGSRQRKRPPKRNEFSSVRC